MNNSLDFSNFTDPTEKIINDGLSGQVKNTTLTVELLDKEGNDKRPDARLVHTDSKGRKINGMSIWTDLSNLTEDQMKTKINNLGKIWKACMPDEEFPKGVNEIQFWQKIEESKGTFDIFVTYGTTTKPNRWLQPRKYDFIQRTGSPVPLTAKPSDVLVRPAADADPNTTSSTDDLPDYLKG